MLRTDHSTALEAQDPVPPGALGGQRALYFDGDLGAGLAFGGQVAGRITDVRPVAEIITEMVRDCETILATTATRYAP